MSNDPCICSASRDPYKLPHGPDCGWAMADGGSAAPAQAIPTPLAPAPVDAAVERAREERSTKSATIGSQLVDADEVASAPVAPRCTCGSGAAPAARAEEATLTTLTDLHDEQPFIAVSVHCTSLEHRLALVEQWIEARDLRARSVALRDAGAKGAGGGNEG